MKTGKRFHAAGSLGAATLCLIAAGCGSTGWSTGGATSIGAVSMNPMEWGVDDAPREGTPEKIVATWVDTVRQETGKTPQRGFGGRVYFYDKKTDPLLVEGRLVVYAFDETSRSPVDHRPTRRYVFPTEQLAIHQSDTEIGPSYSFWLPWDEVGGQEAEVSLIARFEPLKGGGLIVSEQTRQRLPGLPVLASRTGETRLASGEANASPRVRTAEFEQSVAEKPSAPEGAEPPAPRQRLQTTTIQLGKR